jgi:competence protein ComEC
MIYFTAFFISGIVAFRFFPFFPVSIIVSGIIISVTLFIKQKKNRTSVVFLLFVFLSGFIYSGLRSSTVSEIPLTGEKAYVKGTVIDIPEISRGRFRLTLDDVYINSAKTDGNVRLILTPDISHDNTLVNLPDTGDRIIAVTALRAPVVHRNPGVYSYDSKRDGIMALGYIKQLRILEKGSGFASWINKKRGMLGRIIENSLSAENASLHKAIIPGLKRGVGQEMRSAFSTTGLAHLLSISGTHFGLLAFIVYKLIKLIVRSLPSGLFEKMTLYTTPTRLAVILTLPVLTAYALISGASTPTVRSFIMVSIYMFALFLGRRDQWLNSLSIAALVILAFQPSAVFEISFQLSFSAVLFIGLALENRPKSRIEDHVLSGRGKAAKFMSLLKISKHKITTMLIITVTAVIGTAPFVIIYFKQFPLISPITNLLVAPLICFIILPLGFFSSFSSLLFGMQTLPLSKLIDAVTHSALYLIKVFSQVSHANLHMHNPPFLITGIFFILLVIFLKKRTGWGLITLIIVICIYAVNSPFLKNDSLRITFLDAGQGDASVVELPDKKIMLIDGSTHRPDMGSMVIAPFLWSKGIREIDIMAVSHNHPDHFGGFMYIMDHFNVGEIWLNGRYTDERWRLIQKLQKNKIQYKILSRGDLLEAEGYKIHVFHPYDEFHAGSPRGEFSDENSDSVVLKLESGNTSVLFTGDIESEAEQDLLQLGDRLRSDILKVPHHGGRTSSSEAFIAAVSPKIAVISAGRYNSFNHPHGEAIERYRKNGVTLFRTDRDGAVTITLKGRENMRYDIQTYMERRFRKVKALSDEIKNIKILFGTV